MWDLFELCLSVTNGQLQTNSSLASSCLWYSLIFCDWSKLWVFCSEFNFFSCCNSSRAWQFSSKSTSYSFLCLLISPSSLLTSSRKVPKKTKNPFIKKDKRKTLTNTNYRQVSISSIAREVALSPVDWTQNRKVTVPWTRQYTVPHTTLEYKHEPKKHNLSIRWKKFIHCTSNIPLKRGAIISVAWHKTS